MKVLITGGEGQLGQDLVKAFKNSWEVVSTNHQTLDITNKEQTKDFIDKEKPQLVIHSAAWTNVDEAASNPEAALKVNGEGSQNVALAAKLVSSRLVYISTNEVFDGTKNSPYTEDDKTNPINPYGISKLAGENLSSQVLGGDCTIVRASWLYGKGSVVNFPNKILQKASEQGFLKVVEDEISTPTYTKDLAEGVKKLVEKSSSGTYHLVNEGQASRFEWAKKILELKSVNVPIEPIRLKDFNRKSSVPPTCVLANTRAAAVGITLRPWEEALTEYLNQI